MLTFTDTTPLLIGTGATSGTIELDHGVARALGVEPSWWIAVALAYIEFLDERDVSHFFCRLLWPSYRTSQ